MRRRLRNWTIALVVTLCACEGASLLVYRMRAGAWFSYASLREQQEKAAQGRGQTGAQDGSAWARLGMKLEVPHPFLGFVSDPKRARTDGLDYNDYGFPGPHPVQKRSAGKKIVVLLGGSVAFNLSLGKYGKDALVSELTSTGPWKGQEIVFITVALGGYKQPQQLQALSYLLSMGAEYDAVIELDGFNECALAVAENHVNHVFPYYPRSWKVMTSSLDDAPRLAQIGAIAELRRQQAESAAWLRGSRLRWSVTANLLWWLGHARRDAQAARDEAALTQAKDDRYIHSGPWHDYPSEQAMYDEIAQVWRRSSLQMHQLASAAGAAYVHALQPNQYDPGQKPFTQWEKDNIYKPWGAFGPPIEKGYVQLRRAGAELGRAGVGFLNLTGLFKTTTETVYQDMCCHFNRSGEERIGHEIGRFLRERLRWRGRSPIVQ